MAYYEAGPGTGMSRRRKKKKSKGGFFYIGMAFLAFVVVGLTVFLSVRTCSHRVERPDYSTADDNEYVDLPSADRVEVPPADFVEVQDEQNEQPQQGIDSTALEMPRLMVQMPNQILTRLAYTTSYNNQTKCPNWVAWHLTDEHTDGPYPRKGVPYYNDNGMALGIGAVTPETQRGDYFQDQESAEPRQLLTDWPGNEYHMTHGHLCPAADNKWSKEAMNQSFLLTNMCPQDGSLNSGAWQKLEDKCRIWARQYHDIYIVAGPIYDNGKASRTIGTSEVAVPDAFFKVVLCMNDTPKAIGFIYRNDKSSQNMRDAACTVDEVEKITGIDFFFNLPDEIENEVEANANFNNW